MEQASGLFLQAIVAAMEAGERARKRGRKGNAARWLKTHPAPAVTVDQLLMEAYALGFQSDAPRLSA